MKQERATPLAATESQSKHWAWIAYATSFFTGLVILVFELLAFRILAPYFGTSSYVTGIIINTVLLALAVGYYIGGYVADAYRSYVLPYVLILLSSYYLLAVYFAYNPFLKSISHMDSILGSFTAIFVMLFLPMAALAFIPPYLIRMVALHAPVGTTAGKIYSFSTAGSILGGALTTFVLIPFLGSQRSFLLAAGLLVVIAVLGLLRHKWVFFLVAATGVLSLLFEPVREHAGVYYKESQYNIIEVIKDGDEFQLKLNNYAGYHSKSLNEHMMSDGYYDRFLVTALFKEGKEILVLGNGAGTTMTQMSHFFDVNVDGVEIDPEITQAGELYFGLHRSAPDRRIIHTDARVYLNQCSKKYDAIIIDLYSGSPYVPFHVATEEFFRLVRDRLTSDGMISLNIPHYAIGTPVGEGYFNTISRVFPSVYYSGGSNRILYAFKNKTSKEEFVQDVDSHNRGRIPEYLTSGLRNLKVVVPKEGADLFTDDLSPIEKLTFEVVKK